MNRSSPLKSLPSTLLGMLAVFAAMPVLSIPMAGLPWDVYRLHGEAHAALVVFAFWLAPVGLCAAILRRHFLFVPLFLAECFALILNVAMASDAQPVMAKVLRYSLVLVMAGVGVLFVNKDFYFPFLSKRVRFWRRNPRLSANAIVVVSGEAGERLNMMMEDCSATGMAVCGEREPIKAVLKNKPKDAVVNVAVSFRGITTKLACALAWTQDVGGIRRLGLRITDEDLPKMQAVITAARGESRTPVVAALSKHWVKSSVQRTVMILWGTSVFASYAMPACGTSSPGIQAQQGTAAPANAATTTAASNAASGQKSRRKWRIIHYRKSGAKAANLALTQGPLFGAPFNGFKKAGPSYNPITGAANHDMSWTNGSNVTYYTDSAGSLTGMTKLGSDGTQTAYVGSSTGSQTPYGVYSNDGKSFTPLNSNGAPLLGKDALVHPAVDLGSVKWTTDANGHAYGKDENGAFVSLQPDGSLSTGPILTGKSGASSISDRLASQNSEIDKAINVDNAVITPVSKSGAATGASYIDSNSTNVGPVGGVPAADVGGGAYAGDYAKQFSKGGIFNDGNDGPTAAFSEYSKGMTSEERKDLLSSGLLTTEQKLTVNSSEIDSARVDDNNKVENATTSSPESDGQPSDAGGSPTSQNPPPNFTEDPAGGAAPTEVPPTTSGNDVPENPG